MLTQYVHSRLGLPSFEKFQPYFLAGLRALEAGQECLVSIDGGLSPATVAARMRDSLHGFRINTVEWSKIADPEFVTLFAKWDGLFTISGPDINNEVIIRSKRAVGRRSASGTSLTQVVQGNLDRYVRTSSRPSSQPTQDDSITAPNSEIDTLMKYVAMKSSGLLPMAVKFVGLFDQSTLDSIHAAYDVALSYDQQRNITILL